MTAPEISSANRLKRSQDARRERILEATFNLAREGGYDAVQLRAVSRRSGVALATIYKYFASRDHLLAAALTRRPLPELRQPGSGPMSAAEIRASLKRAYRWLMEPGEREPNLLEAWVRSSASRTPEVSAMAAARSDAFFSQLATVFPPDDPGYTEDALMILRNVWYSCVTQLVHGVLSADEIVRQLERTIDRLVPVTSDASDGRASLDAGGSSNGRRARVAARRPHRRSVVGNRRAE